MGVLTRRREVDRSQRVKARRKEDVSRSRQSLGQEICVVIVSLSTYALSRNERGVHAFDAHVW